MKITNVFGDDSDSDNEEKKKPVQVCIHSNRCWLVLSALDLYNM